MKKIALLDLLTKEKEICYNIDFLNDKIYEQEQMILLEYSFLSNTVIRDKEKLKTENENLLRIRNGIKEYIHEYLGGV